MSVAYGRTRVVSDVSFEIPVGGSLALIGESGSGKSTIARSVLRLLPRHQARASGAVRLHGTDVLSIPERRFRPLRGRTLGFVPQDPATSLNAVRRIGSQAQEAAALTGERDRRARRRAVLDVFERVGLPDAERVYDAYPHELSGGMLQRVLIGLTVLPRPDLLVADEPTSALDVTVQRRVLDLLTGLRTELGIGLLLITHDLAVAAERTDRIVVLREGRVEEAGPTAQVFTAPRSQYARDLQADVPALNPDRYRGDRVPSPGPARLELRGVTKTFATGTRALDDVSFSVPAGTTHALVGESGSGKTTAVRVLLGLEQPDAGQVLVAGEEVQGRSHAQLRGTRRHLQLVYQNPFTSLDPTWRLDALVREPLDRYGIGDRAERERRVAHALTAVGLAEHLWRRRPTALSGGQRQRVAIARSLVLRPDVVVLDEPTSALDVSVQADIVEVLVALQRDLGLTYLFVSHDLALVRQFADTVTVLRHGRVVEEGPVERVLTDPREEYTKALVAAVPRPALPAEPALGTWR
nr:ABC transporter ATP-binding protein [Kineococcus aurantiacus]